MFMVGLNMSDKSQPLYRGFLDKDSNKTDHLIPQQDLIL